MAKTKEKISGLIPNLINRLERKNIRVEQLILFGSYATGQNKFHSDIDIAVISPSFQGKGLLKRQELLGEAIYLLKEPIEVIGYTPKEFKNSAPTSFLSEIAATGRVIYKHLLA